MMCYRCDVCRKEINTGPPGSQYTPPPEIYLKVEGIDLPRDTRREICSRVCLVKFLTDLTVEWSAVPAGSAELAQLVRTGSKVARADIEIVSAPGDRCDGSRVLPNDMACPGCRACA